MKTKSTLFVLLCLFLSLGSGGQNNWNIMVIETWTDSQWQNFIRQTNTFDDNNFVVSTLSESWAIPLSEWQNAGRTNYTNNINGTVYQSISQIWNPATESWNDNSRTTNTYNSAGDLTFALRETWLGMWMNAYQTSHSYDSNGFLVNTLGQSWSFFDAVWVNAIQTSYFNNVLGNIVLATNQSWSGSAWANTTQETHHYDDLPDQLSAIDTQTWDGDSWIISYIDYFVYDASGYLTQTFRQNWVNGLWVDETRSLIANDALGNPIEIINQLWQPAENIWENESRITFVNNLGLPSIDTRRTTLFPNPANDFITVQLNGNLAEPYAIYDINGRVVKSGMLDPTETTIDIAALEQGFYIFRIQSSTIKFIKG